jgi:hypothetical protein
LLPDVANGALPACGNEAIQALEADQLHRMSAWAGHAGPRSSWPYINQFEAPLDALMRRARPAAWAKLPVAQPMRSFPDLALDPPTAFATEIELGTAPRLLAASSDVDVETRIEVTLRVADMMPFEVAGAAKLLDPQLALSVLVEVKQAMELARLIKRTPSKATDVVGVVRAYASWIAQTKATKLVGLSESIGRHIDGDDVEALRKLVEAWRQVRADEHISLDDGYDGAQFITALREFGLEAAALLIKSRKGAPALDPAIARFRLHVVEVFERAAKVQHRLQVIDSSSNPEEAAGKHVSCVGLHWMMVLVASWLIARRKLNWS